MPVHPLKNKNGKTIGHQWGKSGKKYYGKDSAKKAHAQGWAAKMSGYVSKDK